MHCWTLATPVDVASAEGLNESLLVIPAKAGIQPFHQIAKELDDTRLLPRAYGHDSMICSGIPGSIPGQALPLQSGLRWDGLFRSSLTPESSGRR